jgi:hypothetical protein
MRSQWVGVMTPVQLTAAHALQLNAVFRMVYLPMRNPSTHGSDLLLIPGRQELKGRQSTTAAQSHSTVIVEQHHGVKIPLDLLWNDTFCCSPTRT